MDFHGRKVVSHGGALDGMFSRIALVPEENLGMVILTNSMTDLPTALMYRILDVFLADEPRDWSSTLLALEERKKQRRTERVGRAERERVVGTTPSLPLAAYAGTYGGEMYGQATVNLQEGAFVLRLLPNPAMVADLRHLHYDTFIVEWQQPFPWFGKGTAEFLVDADGKVTEMKVDIPNDDFWFTELEFKRQ